MNTGFQPFKLPMPMLLPQAKLDALRDVCEGKWPRASLVQANRCACR
jgi:hypothetical protein